MDLLLSLAVLASGPAKQILNLWSNQPRRQGIATWPGMRRGRLVLCLLSALGVTRGLVGQTDIPLTSGVAVTGISGAAGSERYFTIVVPSGAARLAVTTSGGTGDCDLYLRRGSRATVTTFDKSSTGLGPNEEESYQNPAADTYYITLRAYEAYSGVSLTATVNDIVLTSGLTVGVDAGESYAETYYQIAVPVGALRLTVTAFRTTFGVGTTFTYVRRGSRATSLIYDKTGYLNADVVFDDPAPGTYYITLIGDFGGYWSEQLKATVVTAIVPSITTQPVAVRVDAGKTATFAVTASGTPAPTFQWLKDGTPIAGATASSLTLNAVAGTDAGSYTVVVTNSSGSVTSAAAVLTVDPVTITEYTFTTLAGGLPRAAGVAVDSAGNVYATDYNSHTIRKVTSGGVVTTLAGLLGVPGSVDGTGSAARFALPVGVAVDSAGNLYVADYYSHSIRKITSNGEVTTLAGLLGTSGSVDGTGSAARFNGPHGVVVDSTGNVYVVEEGTRAIRKITSSGVVTTLVDLGFPGTPGCRGIALDGAGNFYVADTGNHAVRKVTSAGVVTTLAGLAGTSGSADGTGSAARFNVPTGVAVDSTGNVYVSDTANQTIRKITSGGVVTTLGGLVGVTGSTNGAGGAARFYSPYGVAVDSVGNLYVGDKDNGMIRWGHVSVPTLTSPPTAGGTVGQSFSYQATFAGVLAGPFIASGLPAGLTINATTGLISGTPTAAGTTSVTVGSVNGAGPGSAPVAITIASPAPITLANLTAQQRTGTKLVDITYDLGHLQGLSSSVTVEVSQDGGATWLSAPLTLTGAFGANNVPGSAKLVTWNAGLDWPGKSFAQAKIRVTADDGQTSSSGPAPTGFSPIPAGTFTMGDSLDGDTPALPTHAVTLSAFYMAKTETTKADWDDVRQWAMAHGYSDLPVGAAKASTHPVASVSWYAVVKWLNAKSEKEGLVPVYYTDDAQTTVYRTGSVNVTNLQVKWAATGYRLPTEGEWEYGARGGLAGKRFPWGDTITHANANYDSDIANPDDPYHSGLGIAYDLSPTRGFHPLYYTGNQPYTSPVGSFTANGYGLQDVAGNVWEWCWDWYASYGSTAVTAPVGPASGSNRVFRGGPYDAWGFYQRVAFRHNMPPENGQFANTGFRMARSSVAVPNRAQAVSATFSLQLIDPPVVATPPVNKSVVTGQPATFTVVASGTAPFTYQWRKDGVNVAGATDASYTIASAQPAAAGSYEVVVSNGSGINVTSQPVTLTVDPAWTFSTLAGGFIGAAGVAVDSAGNVYVTEYNGHTAQKIASGGAVTALAGLSGVPGSVDGTGSAARFALPVGVAVDSAGNLYVADYYSHSIRKITSDGVVTTLAGLLGTSGSVDGTGSAARFNGPHGVVVDSTGNVYVVEEGTRAIRKITSSGVVTTLVDLGFPGTPGCRGIALDGAGNFYVADTGNHAVRKVTSAGVVTTLAGLAGTSGSADGTGSAARFNVPTGVAVDSAGNVYVSDTANQTIRKITSGGVVTTLAGRVGVTGLANGTGSAAIFNHPYGIAVDSVGNLYVGDLSGNGTVRWGALNVPVLTSASTASGAVGQSFSYQTVFSGVLAGPFTASGLPAGLTINASTGLISGTPTAAGTTSVTVGSVNGAGPGSASLAITFAPVSAPTIATQPQSVAALAGQSASFSVTVAGTGPFTYQWRKGGVNIAGATNASYSIASAQPAAAGSYDVVVSNGSGGNVTSQSVTLTVDPAWTFTTLAGLAGTAGSADGTGTAARFADQHGLAVDSAGNVYVADGTAGTIRKITSGGVVTTLAGLAGTVGSADGTGSAARFAANWGVAVDSTGNLFVADIYNHTIRKITSGGVVSTLAGLAGSIGSADGVGSAARFKYPRGVAVDGAGNVYVADFDNNTIRKITAGGVVTTLAGLAGPGGSADGAGSAARFSGPSGIALDNAGNLYVSDLFNGAIRKITSSGVVTTLANGFSYPEGIAIDSAGANLYVVENFAIRRVTSTGVVTTIAGLAGTAGSTDGTGSAARFGTMFGIVVDRVGGIYVTDNQNKTLRWGAVTVPTLTSASTARGTARHPFSYQTTFSGVLTGPFSASGLPPGLSMNASTGEISGTPTVVGSTMATVGAVNGAGLGSATLEFWIDPDASAPLITNPPASQTVTVGSNAGFIVVALGLEPFTYQWRKGGVNIAGATNVNYSIASVQLADAGNYDVIVSNPAGNATSSAAVLTVTPPVTAPTITTQPQGGVIISGQTRTLSVTAAGAAPLGYQWYQGTSPSTTVPIAGATAATYTTPALTATASYWVRVSNSAGAADSVTATVSLASFVPTVALTAEPTTNYVTTGGAVTLRARVTYTGQVPTAIGVSVALPAGWSFASYSGGASVSPVVGDSVLEWAFSSIPPNELTFTFIANHPAGQSGPKSITGSVNYRPGNIDVPFTPLALTPISPPTFTTQPVGKLAAIESGTTFSVVASGTGTLSYQWKKDGTALANDNRISGATTATLSLANLTTADAGTYTVVVTNGAGSTTSSAAALAVVDARATHSVSGAGYTAGGTVTLTHTVTFASPCLALRWQLLLPAGWSYASGGGAEGQTKPTVGTTSLLEWVWSAIPASPVTFTVTLNVPMGETGAKTIASLAEFRVAAGPVNLLAKPDPLTISQISTHSADTDRNFRISLIELTRVIELYNTRNGSSRTGCYKVDATGEDGFSPDATRASTTAVTLGSYHSGDSSRDGRFSLIELTRVIELYNTRNGSSRTGAYHTQSGTEDGYAPGP